MVERGKSIPTSSRPDPEPREHGERPVSYTHLDVYKRQPNAGVIMGTRTGDLDLGALLYICLLYTSSLF